ncbi:ferric reduction oxidase 2-like isoform X2 [Rutidosis leptorrhynchoides]|uniref:ferric reduction oxidase 2-like isoform X2 n=1 Tax=Rutidosis leptorrhynchoides TaxID=125765 RepID=UPI003A98F9C6
MVIFLGTIMMWIMLPTNTYSKTWSPNIKSKVGKSTYFGSQGYNLLIFTFPMLFIAILGSLYMHLEKKKKTQNQRMSRKDLLKEWRRPMLVKGPLGIVSWIELPFLTMFIALLVWSLSTYIHNWFADINEWLAYSGIEMWKAKLEDSAVILGIVGNIGLAFLFLPVTRGSSLLPLFGLTSESGIKYHIWLGHIVLALFTAHGICYIIFWSVTNDISQMLKWEKANVSNVAGEISLLAGLIMWATTYPGIRRKFFELFYYSHHLYIVFMVFFVLHVGISYASTMLPGFYLFMVDRFVRFLQSRQSVRLLSARVLSCETTELNFAKYPSLNYTPTSIMFVNVPSISKLQWHPFTVTSNNNLEQDKLSVIIKGGGSWSKKLHQMLSSPSSSIEHLQVSVEGPYGPASTHFLRHETLVMISGGSGITPFISIIRELIYTSSVLKITTPKVILICAFKTSADLSMLELIMPISGSEYDISNLNIQIEAYVTKEQQHSGPTQVIRNSRAIWFKHEPKDIPISPILGPNGWLWLGAIIASSFVTFLIIIGLITRYHIYPTDQNTDKKFSWSIRATLNMLFICVAIVVTASASVLWNKKQITKQSLTQIQNTTLSTPQASPSIPYNPERELESFPQQSLIQAANIHYGQRPNLKKIILGCEGSSIGVLVSGPKLLRHDVANICASGLVANLHFESISFSW